MSPQSMGLSKHLMDVISGVFEPSVHCRDERGSPAKGGKRQSQVSKHALGCDSLSVLVYATGVIGMVLSNGPSPYGARDRDGRE
jgi:hypothetical protein